MKNLHQNYKLTRHLFGHISANSDWSTLRHAIVGLRVSNETRTTLASGCNPFGAMSHAQLIDMTASLRSEHDLVFAVAF